jgi:hypothetical protein
MYPFFRTMYPSSRAPTFGVSGALVSDPLLCQRPAAAGGCGSDGGGFTYLICRISPPYLPRISPVDAVVTPSIAVLVITSVHACSLSVACSLCTSAPASSLQAPHPAASRPAARAVAANRTAFASAPASSLQAPHPTSSRPAASAATSRTASASFARSRMPAAHGLASTALASTSRLRHGFATTAYPIDALPCLPRAHGLSLLRATLSWTRNRDPAVAASEVRSRHVLVGQRRLWLWTLPFEHRVVVAARRMVRAVPRPRHSEGCLEESGRAGWIEGYEFAEYPHLDCMAEPTT